MGMTSMVNHLPLPHGEKRRSVVGLVVCLEWLLLADNGLLDKTTPLLRLTRYCMSHSFRSAFSEPYQAYLGFARVLSSIPAGCAAPANIVCFWVEAHILAAAERCPTARTQDFDLNRPIVRVVVTDILPGYSRLRQAHVQSLHRIGIGCSIAGVAEATSTIGCEDGNLVIVCVVTDQHQVLQRPVGGHSLFCCFRMYPQ